MHNRPVGPMDIAMTKPMMRPSMKIVSIYPLARWATDMSPALLGIRKALVSKNWLLRGRIFKLPIYDKHSQLCQDRNDIDFAALKRTAQDIQPNRLTLSS
jgi:hypothetical protein